MTQPPLVRIVTAIARPFGGTRRFAMQAGLLSIPVAIGCWLAWPRSAPLPPALLWPIPIALGVLIAYAAATRSWITPPGVDERLLHGALDTIARVLAAIFLVVAIAGTSPPLASAILLCIAQTLALAATTIDDGRG